MRRGARRWWLLPLGLAACAEPPPAAEQQAALAAVPSAAERMRAAMQAGARASLDLLLQWDTAGLRHEPAEDAALAELYCFLPAEGCLSEEPGWDHVVAVRGYQVEPLYETPDSAAYSVVFDEIGVVWPDGVEEPQGLEPPVVRFARVAGAWRLVGAPPQPPHLSAAAIARRYRGVQPDSGVIVRWLRERG